MGLRSVSRGGKDKQKSWSKGKGSLLNKDKHSIRCCGETSRAKSGGGQRKEGEVNEISSGNSDSKRLEAQKPCISITDSSILNCNKKNLRCINIFLLKRDYGS